MSAGSPVIQTNLRASKVKMISKPTNQEAARGNKVERSAERKVKGKENRCLSLSPPSLLLFHLRRLLNAQRAMDSSREILLPPSLLSSSNLARERGGERWFSLHGFGFAPLANIVRRGSNL